MSYKKRYLAVFLSKAMYHHAFKLLFVFQAEDGIRDLTVTGVRRVLFRSLMPKILAGLPSSLKVDFLFDQSIFVRAAVTGVIHEGAIAGCLTALKIGRASCRERV